MKYTVIIEETVSDDFEIDANSESEAILRATEKYKNAELVLEPGKIQEVKIALVRENNEISHWEQIV